MSDSSDGKNNPTAPVGPGGKPPPPYPAQPADNRPAAGLSRNMPRPPTPGAAPGPGVSRFDQTTRLIDPANPPRMAPAPSPAAAAAQTDSSDRTVIVGRPATPQGPAPSAASPAIKATGMSDPVVGWLVVVRGPALGRTYALGYGRNSVGRFPEARVALMEDEQVSRATVVNVYYDHVGRQFLATGGEGQTLAYIGSQPVIEKIVLSRNDEIRVGQSTLRLVPLCGPDFDWHDHVGGAPRP